jgi:hypothetical protein
MVYSQQGLVVYEGLASNTVHFLLFIIAGIVSIKTFFPIDHRNFKKIYTIASIVGFILFLFCIRWQPWQTRLQFPFFVLIAPLLAYVLSKIHPILRWGIILYITFLSFYPLFYNGTRALLGPMAIEHKPKESIMFMENQHSYVPYMQTTQFIKQHGYKNIGLFIESTHGYWDYPFWYLLSDQKNIRIEYVDITNISVIAPHQSFSPDVIVCVDCSEESKFLYDSRYQQIALFGSNTLYTSIPITR